MTTLFRPLNGTTLGFLIIIQIIFLQSCSEPADKFFDIAVLNTNTITDFGTPILAKHIADEATEYPNIPSSKKKGDEAVNYVKNNVMYMEKTLSDIKALSANDEKRKVIKQQAIAVYELVIPVYKNEYMAYAKLCDSKASIAQKDELRSLIEKKYTAEFEKRFASLLANGKTFAADNGIQVNWQ